MKTSQSLISIVFSFFLLGFGFTKDNNVASAIGTTLLFSSIVTVIHNKNQEDNQPQLPPFETIVTPPQPTERVYVDGANTDGSLKELNIKVDYEKLAQTIAPQGANLKYYYGVSNHQTPCERRFINHIEASGFQIVKSVKKSLPNGSHKIKGDDVQIATDIALEANPHDHIILVSGDGDFKYALCKIKAKGCEVTVVSSASCLSQELAKVADNIIKIEDIKDQIQRKVPPQVESKSQGISQPILGSKYQPKTT